MRPAAFGRRFDNGTGAAGICFWQSGHIGPGFELAAHGYAVQEVQPVDMFPQTVHLECVVWMSKEKYRHMFKILLLNNFVIIIKIVV